MGSSVRTRLKAGKVSHVTEELTAALKHIEEAAHYVHNACDGEDQVDDASDNGGLLEILYLIRSLIRMELPDEGKCTTCGRIRGGP